MRRGAGRIGAVLAARVAALAVHDHAAGQDDAPGEAAAVEGGEQLAGADAVVGGVGGSVGEVDAETYHRRLMA